MQAYEPGEVRAGDEAEVFVAIERRNLAEAAAREKDGGRAQNQVQVLGVGNDDQKDQNGQRVDPPENPRGRVGVGDKKRGQVGDHQQEDEEGDEAGLPGELLAEPPGPDQETADEEAEDARRAGQRKDGGKIGVEAAKGACGVEKAEAKADGEVVCRHQDEGAETPEDEGVSQAGKRALADDFGLEGHLPDEIPDAFADGEEMEAGVFFGFEDFVEDDAKAAPETGGGGGDQRDEEQFLRQREVLRFSQGCG